MLEQLKLLLWKNYTLRRRRKLRLFVEIFWPLFIFIITAWVRTRVPRSHQNQCHYYERTLPSGGTFSFLSDFICETNNTCYDSPKEKPKTYQIRKFTQETIDFLNRKKILESISEFFEYIPLVSKQRQDAENLSKKLPLSDILSVPNSKFKSKLSNISEIFNSTIFNMLLDSTPNFNMLFSVYSSDYLEPIIPNGGYEHFKSAQNLLNLLYGSNVERMNINRAENKVGFSVWIRNKMCQDDQYFFLNANPQLIKIICVLENTKLEEFSISLSTNINFTRVKEKIYSSTSLDNSIFYLKTLRILSILTNIQNDLMSDIKPNNSQINSINDIFENLKNSNFTKFVCGDSRSSIFNRIKYHLEKTELINKSTRLEDILEYLDLDNLFKINNNFYSEMSFRDLRLLLEQVNDLNRQKSDCFFIKKKYLNQLNEYEKSSTCFCKTIFKTIKVLPEDIQVLFKQIKPMLFGKILYAPNNSLHTNEIIKKANLTFQNIDNFSQMVYSIVNLTDSILVKLNLTSDKNTEIFSWKAKKFLKEFLNVDLSHKYLINLSENLKFLKEILNLVKNLIDCFEQNRFVGFKSEQDAVRVGEELMEEDLFWAMVIFNETNSKIIDYKIRMNASKTHDTAEAKDKNYNFAPKDCPTCNPYILFGFIYVQDLIEKAIVEFKTNKTQTFGIVTQMTPYPCYIADKFLIDISKSLPLFMVISWVYTVSTLVKDIVYEKEKKLKEFMQIMGLSNWAYWLSWFISYFTVMFFVSVIICWVMKLGNITIYSDVSVLISFFTCFNLATISQCVLISKFFNKASLASVVAGIAYFVLFLPYALLLNHSESILPWQQFLASLSSTVAFSYCAEIMATFELQAKGIKWENINSTPFAASQFTMSTMCIILLFDSVLYLILAWYIEALFPGEYGVPKKWYFPLQKSYWSGETTIAHNDDNKKTQSKHKKCLTEKFIDFISKKKVIDQEDLKFKNFSSPISIDAIDPSPVDEAIGIEIKNLHKIYSRGKNHALKGLTVNFYENELTALLGHNGAGKSTTMHLLTGLYKPTYGQAKIYGLDISQSMEQIRKSLGFVPQHNILFSKLTVYEHLIFYACLKGLSMRTAISEAEHILEETGLIIYRDQYAKKLSGGMQRMLSIGIAFIGGSKTVILDEPTAGVDLGGRRSVWDLLLKYKRGRTLIITTHHLDEAEILSDRVVIVANGELVSYGTLDFLKKKFSNGYYLTLAKKSVARSEMDPDSRSQETLSLDFKRDRINIQNLDEIQETNVDGTAMGSMLDMQDELIYNFVTSRIEKAILVDNNCSEITFSIPYTCETNGTYKEIFNQIEENMTQLGIQNIGLSDTSLEEIFIKLVKMTSANNQSISDSKNLTNEQIVKFSQLNNYRLESKVCLFFQQMFALITKRFHRTRRNVKGFVAETVLPIVFVCLALFVANFAPLIKDKPSLELHPWWFEGENTMFISRNSSTLAEPFYTDLNQTNITLSPFNPRSSSAQINKIWKTYLQSPGPGSRCVKDHTIKVNHSSKELSKLKTETLLKCQNYDFEIILPQIEHKKSVLTELVKSNFSRTKVSKNCECKSGFPECALSSGGDVNLRAYYKLKTGDILYDLTGRNVTDWLIKTEFSNTFFEKRYGGIEFIELDSKSKIFLSQWKKFSKNFLKLFISAQNLTRKNSKNFDHYITKQTPMASKYIKIWYNTKGYHANVAYLNLVNNALLRSELTDKTNADEYAIIAHNHPMKFSKHQFLVQLDKRVLIDLFVAIFIIFALSFIPASFLVFLVEERENNSKQLQFVSGIQPYVYWISNLFWDFFNYILPACICLIIFLIFDTKTFTSKENFPCLVMVIFLYGWACIPLMYPINFLFKLAGSSFVISSSLNIFIGVSTTTTTTVLNSLSKETPELAPINQVLKIIFTIFFPHYCLGEGMLEMSRLHNMAEVKRNFGYRGEYSPFDFDKIGRNLCAMFIQGICYFTLIILIEYNFFVKYKPDMDASKYCVDDEKLEDGDVLEEKNRVLEKDSQIECVKLINLCKEYKNFMKSKENIAVKGLCLGIKEGECFGLLGINGAGKSTTFKIITGEILPSAGDVVISGNSILAQRQKALDNIGYCPQKNAIFPLLTAKEHLKFYARIRGIPEEYINDICMVTLERFGLNIFSNRIAHDYSGGNKRKLSTAIAILGNPKVICLDEPTSGMDAQVRRVLWKDILSLIKEKRVVILTSHSMTECESLCTRLAIMVNGRFRCLGSPQHLKSKYGNGYRIVLKIQNSDKNESILDLIRENFTSPNIKDIHRDSIEFNLPFESNKLSHIFGVLEENKNNFQIQDYSISQSSLDQIFVNFSETNSKIKI
uniref:ATP-binding cassette transporter subfamily A member 1-like protein X2 n=1 Tax=Brachionus rotundiformis TaxID=96890 RepID=A0A7H9SPM0_9BILA|nr:ATP-binding cassette transporter subfamily A member 1-like protein X2 [Brachionus rotundiformis]